MVGHTGVILALDSLPDACRELECLGKLISMFDGVKVGLPLLLREGTKLLRDIAKLAQRAGVLGVADFKLADIGDIMSSSLEAIAELSYSVAIVHAFVGVRGGLEVLVDKASKLGVNVALLISMSHEGSKEFYDKHFNEFLKMARELGVWGVVVPATKPHLISEARTVLGNSAKILSPGVGVQGAKYGTAICHGANYEIVGRSVVRAPDPFRVAGEVISEVEKEVRACHTNSV
ncbi:MAG: orotidine-5'-phosphate decarboxylase [Sulfolobales archaeon]